ncbi:MAG: HAMP domain-containing protein, partial [Actinobacteria bacterium]|nr:HAMP domain-containing protein [Actinomycetota bacterium]
MRVRTRLLLAFTYILLVVIVALEIPFAINLNRRALREEESRVVTQAQSFADFLELDNTLVQRRGERRLRELQEFVEDQRVDLQGGRLIVTDPAGEVLADSGVPSQVGQSYGNRPEIATILESEGTVAFATDQRYSQDLGQEILTAAAAVHGGDSIEGVTRVTVGLDAVNQEVRRILTGTAVIGLAGVMAGLAIAWIIAGSFARPLRRLADAAHRLGEGDLEARSGVT